MSSTASVYTALTFNGFVFCSLLIGFEYLRTRQIDIYAPKTRGKKSLSPSIPYGWFEWILKVYNAEDNEILRVAGMDALVLLRFLLFCSKLTGICSIGSIILIPVYYYTDNNNNDDVTGIDLASMANINPNGIRLWVSFIFIYLFTGIFLYLIHLEYEYFAYQRSQFFLKGDQRIPAQMKFTIQVENIPPEFRTSYKLKQFFEQIFPNEILYACIEVSMPELDNKIKERNEMILQVEDEIAEYEANNREKRPMLKLYEGMYTFYIYRIII